MKRNFLTKEEINIIEEAYSILPKKEFIKLLPNRAYTVIRSYAYRHGIKKINSESHDSKGKFIKGHKCLSSWAGKKRPSPSDETRKKLSNALKGIPSGRLGEKASDETKLKMSKTAKEKGFGRWMTGKKLTLETKTKIKNANSGENAPAWKGGITSEVKLIRASMESRTWKNEVFKRDDWTCQHCEKRGGYLHAHHIKLFSEYPEFRFDINNGITLCKSCHMRVHSKINIPSLTYS